LYHSNYYFNTFYLFDLLDRSLLAWCISECLLLDSSRLPTLSSTKSLSLSLFANAWSDIVGQLFLVLTRSETPSAPPVHLRSILLPQVLSNDSSKPTRPGANPSFQETTQPTYLFLSTDSFSLSAFTDSWSDSLGRLFLTRFCISAWSDRA
jgi:hypothetical protein